MKGLREARRAQGMTQKRLSVALGISVTAISLYEHGKMKPRLKTLMAMAEILHVSIDYLVSGEEVA